MITFFFIPVRGATQSLNLLIQYVTNTGSELFRSLNETRWIWLDKINQIYLQSGAFSSCFPGSSPEAAGPGSVYPEKCSCSRKCSTKWSKANVENIKHKTAGNQVPRSGPPQTASSVLFLWKGQNRSSAGTCMHLVGAWLQPIPEAESRLTLC